MMQGRWSEGALFVVKAVTRCLVSVSAAMAVSGGPWYGYIIVVVAILIFAESFILVHLKLGLKALEQAKSSGVADVAKALFFEEDSGNDPAHHRMNRKH
jgi:hypothetical protein